MLIPKTKMRLEKKRSTFGGGKRTVALLAEMCDGPHLVRRASSSLVHPPRILKGFAFEVTALGATKSKSSGRKSAGWSPAASAAESANVGARLPNALRGTEGNFLRSRSAVGGPEGKRIDGCDAARARVARARRGRGRTKDRRRGHRHTQSRRSRSHRRRTRPIRTSAPRGAGGSGWRVSGEVEKRDCEATSRARAEPTERAITHHLDVERGTAKLGGFVAAAPRHREGGASHRVHRARRRGRRRFTSGASREKSTRDARWTRILGRIAGHARERWNASARRVVIGVKRVNRSRVEGPTTGESRGALCRRSPAPITVQSPVSTHVVRFFVVRFPAVHFIGFCSLFAPRAKKSDPPQRSDSADAGGERIVLFPTPSSPFPSVGWFPRHPSRRDDA